MKSADLYNQIKNIPASQVNPDHGMSINLLLNYERILESFLLWGKKLLEAGYEAQGSQFIKTACLNANKDAKPEIIYIESLSCLGKHGLEEIRHGILHDVVKSCPNNLFVCGLLAEKYKKTGILVKQLT